MKRVLLFLLISFLSLTVYAVNDSANSNSANSILRIGTTGDYPPLTQYNEKSKRYSGFDIEMVRRIAHDLSLKIKFIKTTWPTLNQDLTSNKFDIAIGGISATPERHEQFLVTEPITTDGKVALVRCDEAKQYATLDQINQPKVRVVENKGGTNMQFAQDKLKNAQIILVDNNELPFKYLQQSRADVMITDKTEARFRQQNTPGLCIANSTELFMPEIKIYLIQKSNSVLLNKINNWLKDAKNNGQLDEVKQKWGVS